MTMTNQTVSNPIIGMGATILHHSDRTPVTIIDIYQEGKRIVLQEDKVIRLDNRGMSESQEYSYTSDPQGKIFEATLRKDGSYKLVKSTEKVALGYRQKYYDFSF